MITIDIPECAARKSAEDELVEYILNRLSTNGVAYFKYYTSDQNHSTTTVGDWKEIINDWNEYKGETHKSSLDAVKSVIQAFKQKGYLVKNMFTFAHFNQVTISK